MPDTNEALKIWNALRPMIDKEIAEKTENCVRAKKMIVKQANVRNADGTVSMGVAEPYGDKVTIPSNSQYDDVNPGSSVWVQWYFNNASTMHVSAKGDGVPGDSDISRLESAIVSIGPASASDGVITIPYTTAGGDSGSVNFNIADMQFYIESVSAAYDSGWNAALDACTGHNCYTGTVRQLYDSSLDVYVNAVNPYQQRYYYSLPTRK